MSAHGAGLPGERIAPTRRPAQPTLAPGLERIEQFVVGDLLLTDVGGTIGVAVLSTPGMVAMMERASAVLAHQNLPEGKATVGFEVCVKHVAAALEGSTCAVRSVLREVIDGRSFASKWRSARVSARSASAPTSAA